DERTSIPRKPPLPASRTEPLPRPARGNGHLRFGISAATRNPLIRDAGPGQPAPVRAHPPQAAFLAAWPWAADRAAVPDQVDVQLIGVRRIDHPQYLVVCLLERGALAEQAQPSPHAVDVRADRDP